MRELSTDRPDKTESPYTVDAGHVQIETDLLVYTRDRSDGVTVRKFDVLPFNLKVGLTNASDLQIVYGSFSRVQVSGPLGVKEVDDGTGDLLLRYKRNLWDNDGGRSAVGIMPFVKIPTNTLAFENDSVEGGVIVPLALKLTDSIRLGLMTEVDMLRGDRGNYEPTFINTATIGFELTKQLGAYLEVYTERSAESGSETVATIDSGITFAITDNLQLDAGINLGVTDASEDFAVFAGMSRRF